MLDWLLCFLVRLISGLLCLLPPGAAIWLGGQFGLLAYWLQPKRTRIGFANLRAAFDGQLSPAQTRRIIRACYRQLGAGIFELLRLPVIDRAYIDRYITVEGRDHFEAAVSSGRPVMFLTGHFGSWELSSIFSALCGHPITALARAQEKFPRLYRLLVSYRESKGCTIVHKGGAMRRLIVALEQNGLVGIVADQASRQGRFIDFLGRPALFAAGPFELALRTKALIVPAFIHRLRGAHHRLVIEPPFDPAGCSSPEASVREGLERFAGALTKHIKEDPTQWLWMHKRWKHTPARRLLVLSDGKAGHVKQSLAVAEALRRPSTTFDVVEIAYRHRFARALALLWAWWLPRVGATACLRWTLTPEAASTLLSRHADAILSCGSSAAAANVLWAQATGAKSLVIMDPRPLPLRRFHLVAAPRHDRLPRAANVVPTSGALAASPGEAALQDAAARLQRHPRFRSSAAAGSAVAVLIGGDTKDYEVTPAFAEALVSQVMRACEEARAACLVTTSRRTSPEAESRLAGRLEASSLCRLLLLAGREAVNGTMEGLLGSAAVVVVTGESISMVSEACASGRRVIVIEPPLRPGRIAARIKHHRFMRDLAQDGYIRLVPVDGLAAAVRDALDHPAGAPRLDDLAAVAAAAGKLL